ncbi:SusC/RagA family TonB-linked outer membrane protein [Dinghuibacter silviterrae]|uniref:TonB-linked SusC/RagA family outer membrane protein n=1 Tax=Dinghuibacter silviterrae TaxID=1539049 RepID=A0A4R8DJG3_9BACT|nr:SusC/RagA family TonB-linked outer membrane protein [Dinghuibacter silviterrae]TDW97454.1 TonB-linked SusC/RagA family outer membrane protein [Dinghuibacter silviterrae]
MRRLLHLLLFIPCMAMGAWAAPVRGVVRETTGQPLQGVTVSVKNARTATLTDAGGRFSISAKPGDVLVFTLIGYGTKEVTVTVIGEGELTVELSPEARKLDAIVVTALGIRRSEKSLTYSTQQISGSELTNVKTDNLMNSLNGKIAGVTIAPSASGIGGSVRVILRGNRSTSGNNQPLYVIDGVPISNDGNPFGQPAANTYGGNPEGSDGISNLNPEDIESMTVLKGASASALYGSQAANGVIVITTKKGRAGKTLINFSSSLSIDTKAYTPEFQSNYGETSPGAVDSWGPKITGAHDNLKDFFQTGGNLTNAISLSGGSDIAQTYFSYTNTSARGVTPENSLARNNFNFHETARFLDNKLTLDGNVNYITQTLKNSPPIGFNSNPLTGLYFFPRGLDILPYKRQFELPPVSGGNGAPTQNWPFHEDIQQNPWWIIHRNTNENTRNRIMVNVSAKYDFTNWLSVQARGNVDRIQDIGDQKYYAGTLAPLAAPNGNGSWNGFNHTVQNQYGDVLVTLHTPGNGAIKIDGVAGASISDNVTTGIGWGPGAGQGFGLYFPNLFTIQNIEVAPAVPLGSSSGTYGSNVSTDQPYHNQIQSVFANANLSYKDWAYLTVSGRNDWSSNLAFTSTDHYFYPSVGLSFILSQMIHLPDAFTYAKVRGTYSQVGNTVGQYQTNPVNTTSTNSTILNQAAPSTLKPEQTKTYELGTDLRLFKDRLSVGFTWYKTNTYNQDISIVPLPASGYASQNINAGNIQNEGIEATAGYNWVISRNLSWNTMVNASENVNRVIDIDSKDGVTLVDLTPGNNNYDTYVAKGGSFGDIYVQTLQTDAKGRLVLTPDGNGNYFPVQGGGELNGYSRVGNPNPKFQLGWNNSFSYKNFSFNFLVDGKFGGQVVSVMQGMLDFYGVSKVSGQARDKGYVAINGVDPNGNSVSEINPKNWYTFIGGRNATLGEYVYSATVVRLREVALGYSVRFAKKVLRLSLTGRNLLYFYRKAPYDPEIASSTGNGLGGVDVFNLPAMRTYGLKLNLNL